MENFFIMDIIISDKWLREYLDTLATPKQIAKCVSLCGPSIEKLEEKDGDILYHAEITTNRIDCVGVYGFAREVAAILPRFKIPAKLKSIVINKKLKYTNNLPFTIINNDKLVKRAMGVVLTNIENWKTPSWMEKRLTLCGVRSLNAVVDITNYVMLETGHPCHVFDYDKIKNKKFVIRESKKGEKVTSFDNKTYELFGGDIVFDDGSGEIIDLPGIIGTKNSVVGPKTKRLFFFIDNNDPARIRNTSMGLAIRTMAASINEKGVDPELGEIAIFRGVELYQKICKARVASKVFDAYPHPYKMKTIKTNLTFINTKLGIEVEKKDISKYLTALNFIPKWQEDILSVSVPSHRTNDINIPEDLVEEIARIYGYHNLPSKLMEGALPDPLYKSTFNMEWKIKNILKALGGYEVYTLSLVPKNYISEDNSLKLKNPLGSDTKYLRTDLSHSLVESVKANNGNYEQIFLFEMANVYMPKKGEHPNEEMVLGLCFDGYKYVEVKGVLDSLITNELKTKYCIVKTSEENLFAIEIEGTHSGYINLFNDGIIVVEINAGDLISFAKNYISFKPIPKHPPQIEDLTIKIPAGVEVGKVMQTIKSVSNLVSDVELRDTFKDSYTFRIEYLDPDKTLTDQEVENVRKNIMSIIRKKHNINL